MKIEITDRKLWLERCETAIKNIKALRAKEDIEYVDNWRNSRWKLFSREGKFPEKDFLSGYPSYSFEYAMIDAKLLKNLLVSEGTGAISLDEEEHRSIITACRLGNN